MIPHLFHIIPGGTYIRQAGSSKNPYAYGLLREISDHTHHQESGWAHAGVLVMQGDDIPAEFKNSVLMGSIHGCSIKRDILERRGSTFVAHHGPDFLVSGDKNFRPINMRWGPDGSIYVIDWHDQNPCHQAAPDSWDMTHGRIYKIQRKGTKPTAAVDLSRKTNRELVEILRNNNPWWHRTALRLLKERRDKSVSGILRDMLDNANETVALRALWALHAIRDSNREVGSVAHDHRSAWPRAWAFRLEGEDNSPGLGARSDEAPEVRLQLACTCQHLSPTGRLPILLNLMRHKEDAHDPCIPLMIWLALEPILARNPSVIMGHLALEAPGNDLVTAEIVPRAMRRLAATGRQESLAMAIAFIGDTSDLHVKRQGLVGLLQALENRQADPPPNWQEVSGGLLKDSDRAVQRLARRLALKLHDMPALRRAIGLAVDDQKPLAERLEAIHDLAAAHPPEALQPLENLLFKDSNVELRSEVCRTLAAYDRPEIARAVLKPWKDYPQAVRVDAVNLLAGRKDWARELLAAVGRKEVPRTDLNDNTILRIRALRDKTLNDQIEKVWGRVRDKTPAELNQLIEHMRVALDKGRGSFERGRMVFENQCAKCHRFEGKGHDVGPNLDGAARDIDYLLVNILDPNRVVGQPYYTRFVALKNGRIESGLLHAEDEQSVTLKTENDNLKVILRKDIDEITVQEKSLMPEGLNKNLTEQDFRDLIRYLMANPFLTDVALAGPFAANESVAINKTDPMTSEKLPWARPVVGPTGRIALPSTNQNGESVVYVAAEAFAPAALRSRLHLGSSASVQAWLNGKPIYQGRPSNGPVSPDQSGADVDLREGRNRLLFQVTYRGNKEALFARLLDPQRKLRYPEPKE